MFHVVQLWKAPPFREGSITSLAVEIDTRWSYRGEGLLVSRLSGGQEIAGSTPAISTEVKA